MNKTPLHCKDQLLRLTLLSDSTPVLARVQLSSVILILLALRSILPTGWCKSWRQRLDVRMLTSCTYSGVAFATAKDAMESLSTLPGMSSYEADQPSGYCADISRQAYRLTHNHNSAKQHEFSDCSKQSSTSCTSRLLILNRRKRESKAPQKSSCVNTGTETTA